MMVYVIKILKVVRYELMNFFSLSFSLLIVDCLLLTFFFLPTLSPNFNFLQPTHNLNYIYHSLPSKWIILIPILVYK